MVCIILKNKNKKEDKMKKGNILKLVNPGKSILKQLELLTDEQRAEIRQEVKNNPSPFFEEFVNPLTLSSNVQNK